MPNNGMERSFQGGQPFSIGEKRRCVPVVLAALVHFGKRVHFIQKKEEIVGHFRRRLQSLLERVTGFDIEPMGPRSIAVFPRSQRQDAWWSYRAQIRTLIKQSQVDLVVDVGANEGQFGKMIRAFYPGEILSFEPVPLVFEKLCIAAQNDPAWRVVPLALGAEEGDKNMFLSPSTVFSSLLKTNDYCLERFGAAAKGLRNEVVPVRRLDTFLDASIPDLHRRRIFLKMDTQGYDANVFGGLGDAVAHVVAIQSEVSMIPIYEGMPHWTESVAIYEKKGFSIAGMFPVNRDANRIIEYDCVLVKADS